MTIASPDPTGPAPRSAALWLGGAALAAFALSRVFPYYENLTSFFLQEQDIWLLVAGAGSLLIAAMAVRPRTTAIALPLSGLIAGGLLLLLLSLAGHHLVLAGHDMSRDEQMASFDAAIFASGRLVAPLPALWRDHADALNTLFLYPAEHRGAWASTYLPVNAALRALTGTIATPALTGPLLTLLGGFALWKCAARIWPGDREAPLVALLLYFGSGQVLVTGMTAYAMPAHLALNLCWLWLFLMRRWWADVAALAVGFMAVGIHQPVMHPLFAAPLLCLLLRERAWRRAALYALGYAAIGLFWAWWPSWISTLIQASADAPRPPGVDFISRLASIRGDGLGLQDMGANLLRFVAWQHLLLLPLLAMGAKIARRDPLAGALAIGLFLTIAMMSILLPYQGHGFGYRYLHGLIGNAILLAVHGWMSLGARKAEWRGFLLRASLLGIVLILPLQLWMAHALYSPAAKVGDRIGMIDADYVLVDKHAAPFAIDLVDNAPTLGRPIRLIQDMVTPELARTICARAPVVAMLGDPLFDRMNAYFGIAPAKDGDEHGRAIAVRLRTAGCHVTTITA